MPRGTTATIEPNGFFGDQLIALHPDKPNIQAVSEGDTILAGHPTPQIGDVLARVDTIAGRISVLTAALNKELVETGGFTEIRQAIRQSSELMKELQDVAAQQNAELPKTQASIRRLANSVDSAQVDSTVRALRATATNVSQLAADLKNTTDKLNGVLLKASEGPGTAGKLMNDPAMYNDVRALLQRLDSLTADFQKNPRKYIKFSIF